MSVELPVNPSSLSSRIYFRLMPLLFIMGVCAFLDRVNVGFAAPTMREDLHLSATVYGAANSFFYIGFVLLEVPSNLILARVGARLWLARIMITWGLVSAATMFTVGPNSFYSLRFLLGVCEAGFVPGVLLYLSYWIPLSRRARATGLFIVAQPLTLALGAFASGFLLNLNGALGLRGWQWMFLIEGGLSVLVGLVTLLMLDDHPRDAKWLSDDDRGQLRAMLDGEDEIIKPKAQPFWAHAKDLLVPDVLRFSLVYFCLTFSLNPISTWTPQIVQSFRGQIEPTALGILSAVPPLAAVLAMVICSRSSDLWSERRFHVIGPMAMAAIGWLLTGFSDSSVWKLVGLAAAAAGSYAALGVFWSMPGRVLDPAIRVGGLALVAALGILGSVLSPITIGFLRDLTGSFASGLAATSAMLSIGMIVYLTSPTDRRVVKDSIQPAMAGADGAKPSFNPSGT
jgi:ACS family 4-hydroxyphenylacetate permease-like MFS transporter